MTVRKVLLVCGILASLLYVGTDILGAMLWESYSYTAQTISELSAIGAPTRPIVAPLFFAYGPLMIAFGFGVWRSADRKRTLRILAGLLIGFGVLCMTGPFTPMHQREVLAVGGKTWTDTLHIVGATADVLFIALTIGFGAMAFGKRFRFYSIGALVVVLVFGALADLDGPRIEANLPTPWVGIHERISAYAYMLWVLVLAISLLRAQKSRGREGRQTDT